MHAPFQPLQHLTTLNKLTLLKLTQIARYANIRRGTSRKTELIAALQRVSPGVKQNYVIGIDIGTRNTAVCVTTKPTRIIQWNVVDLNAKIESLERVGAKIYEIVKSAIERCIIDQPVLKTAKKEKTKIRFVIERQFTSAGLNRSACMEAQFHAIIYTLNQDSLLCKNLELSVEAVHSHWIARYLEVDCEIQRDYKGHKGKKQMAISATKQWIQGNKVHIYNDKGVHTSTSEAISNLTLHKKQDDLCDALVLAISHWDVQDRREILIRILAQMTTTDSS